MIDLTNSLSVYISSEYFIQKFIQLKKLSILIWTDIGHFRLKVLESKISMYDTIWNVYSKLFWVQKHVTQFTGLH